MRANAKAFQTPNSRIGTAGDAPAQDREQKSESSVRFCVMAVYVYNMYVPLFTVVLTNQPNLMREGGGGTRQ